MNLYSPQKTRRSFICRLSRRFIAGLALAVFVPSTVMKAAQSPPATPAGPTAATQQERDAFRVAAAARGGAAEEKAGQEFAARYPQSALRLYLFEKALRQYEIENDAAGVRKTAQEILAIDPGDPLALVLTATADANDFSPGEPDQAQKASLIRRSADLALRNLERGVLPAAISPQRAGLYRTTLQAMAYSALGILKLKTGDDAGAEKDLKMAVELAKAHPDPSIWYHLALAQDHRKKYSSAINSVEQAMQLASSNPQLQRLAEMEHDRLNRLAGHNRDSGESEGSSPPQ